MGFEAKLMRSPPLRRYKTGNDSDRIILDLNRIEALPHGRATAPRLHASRIPLYRFHILNLFCGLV
jgi:hypothetical protein